MTTADKLRAVGLFDVHCSIYAHVKDRTGQYFDRDTGEVITQMSVADFLLGNDWAHRVQQLRDLIASHGAHEAKALPEYGDIKRSLPAATLSGLFSRRRTDCLIQHTGLISIDIDLQDNLDVSMEDVIFTLRHRPEVVCYMKSCSGTGYFALIRLAYPATHGSDIEATMQDHKAQFASLREEYAALGITLDRSCSDITRLRIASTDPDIWVNMRSIPYRGMMMEQQRLTPVFSRAQPFQPGVSSSAKPRDASGHRIYGYEDALRLVERIEQTGTDVTGSYDDCTRIGMSLHTLGDCGLDLWKRVCRFRGANHATMRTDSDLEHRWRTFHDGSITIRWFIAQCWTCGVRFK